MSFSMPGNNLYYLPRDDLAPERYEEIISPSFAWSDIDIKYVFDDRPLMGFQIINMRERNFNGYTNQLPPHGPREREKLKNMLYNGEVVMLGGFSASPGCLFYITNDGALICRDPLVFAFDGARKIIQQYKNSIARRDYSQRGGKPRPTILPVRSTGITQPEPLNTLNSKAAGRLLAAGGIYNGNPEDFRKTAEQLGGDAPAGYDQVMNEQTKGLFIAAVSVAAGLMLGRVNIGIGKRIIEATEAENVVGNTTMKGSGTNQIGKFSFYAGDLPFNPLGTGGAAQSWSIKGRIKSVQLPYKGKIRYIPSEGYTASQPLPRGPNNGYIDKFRNEWVKGPSRTASQVFEWDVQLSRVGKAQLGWATRDGSHLNISLDGKITHK